MPNSDREALRGALLNVLCNASNFPEKVQPRILGQDMRPLVEKVLDAVLASTPDDWEYRWADNDFPERRRPAVPAGPWEPAPTGGD